MININFKLPNSDYLENFGGSSIIFKFKDKEYIIMSARNKKNHSNLLVGKFENKNILDLKRIKILENNDYKNSKGFSYPFVISFENKIILFFTEWYEEKKIIKNRLCFSNLENNNDRFLISDIKNIGGQFNNAGAVRIITPAKNKKGSIFVPFFVNEKFEYNIFSAPIISDDLRNLTKIKEKNFSALNFPFKRTSCMTEFQYKGKKYFIFCARNDDEYSTYISNKFTKNTDIEIIKKFSFKGGLCYPYLNSLENPKYFIASKGRYGKDGLLKINLDF